MGEEQRILIEHGKEKLEKEAATRQTKKYLSIFDEERFLPIILRVTLMKKQNTYWEKVK